MTAVLAAMRASGPGIATRAQVFEGRFAEYAGRAHGVSFGSATLALLACLRAMDIGPGDEVVAPSYSWHQIAHAIALAGATPVFADIDYWSGTITAESAGARIGGRTRAILACNAGGHPAPWAALRELAARHGLPLIEDSTEAIGSARLGRRTGSFGDAAIFDFSAPSALDCGGGAMVLADDARLASELRYVRRREPEHRRSVSVGSRVPIQAPMSEWCAALGIAQLSRIAAILERRLRVEQMYERQMQSFEGIKPPYRAPEVEELHRPVYLVHLGTRFTRSARDQILDDLATERIEAAVYCEPLHRQFAYGGAGGVRARLPVTERIADRALALPFHAGLDEDEVAFVVRSLKDSSVNVGAGAAIY